MALLAPDTQAPLQPVQFGDVRLDVSPETGGVWFDLGEIGKLRRRSDPALKQLEQQFPGVKAVSETGPVSTMVCPNDGQPLTQHFYGENQTMPIYECVKCGGIWVDHNTLDKIADAQIKESPDYVPPNLSPEAREVLGQAEEQHRQFMDRVHGITSMLQMIDHRPGWPKPWLDQGWYGQKDREREARDSYPR
jgi:Zn-finger nucleic acid-binding protein